ncbi:NAD(P)-binding protein [Pholiota conissans]|uniref:NAD(P)-binding protein n=1 Tax=Pholiota conissans TaxID=109636 RepID=A0A9P5YQV1_9AGAR|nr:NAD(P)-binding protein [Pholiota conissans]
MAKIVLITGASQGANSRDGFELARLIAEKGRIVYVGSRNDESGKTAVGILHSEGLSTVKPVMIDITKPSTIESAKNAIEAAEGRLDVLVNNVGIALMDKEQLGLYPDMTAVREIMATNFFGTIETTVAFLPLLRKSCAAGNTPIIVNVSSGLGSNTLSQEYGRAKYVGYRASKVALNSYTISLALELQEGGFKVNAPIRDGGLAMLPWALLDAKGPTGKFFGPGGDEYPW